MPRILGLWYDPTYQGQRIHERYGWTDPRAGLQSAMMQLNSVMPDAQHYLMDMSEILIPWLGKAAFGGVQNLDRADASGPTVLTPEQWVANWDSFGFSPNSWPGGGDIHVKSFVLNNNLVSRINSGAYDEIWTGGLPIPAAFEGAMLAPPGDVGAFPCHDRLFYVPGLQRRCVWHMAQVSNWNLLHNYWHRIEAIMSRIWGGSTYGYAEQWSSPRGMENVKNYWELFTLTENEQPGEAQNGSCHFMPNGKLGYVYDMADAVPSGAHLWKNYPDGFPLDLGRNDRFQMVSEADWRGRPDYLWQFEHIPRNDAVKHDGRRANWWRYITNVNETMGATLPSTRPWTGTPRPIPNVVARYGDRAVVRWQARPSDPENGTYRVLVDGKEMAVIPRRGGSHLKLSAATSLGRAYTVKLDGGWESTWDQNVPTPDVTPAPGGTMLTAQQVAMEIDAIHKATLMGCPQPSIVRDDGPNVLIQWEGIKNALGFDVSHAVNKSWTIETFRMWYPAIYPAEARARCGGIIPGPGPDPDPGPAPDPTPTPNASLKALFDVQIDSLKTQLQVWQAHRDLLE